MLDSFGKVIFCEPHYLNHIDLIVKFEKIEDSQSAFNFLSNYYWVTYIETQHGSDEQKFYTQRSKDHQDASLTLNMLKLKQQAESVSSRNLDQIQKPNGFHPPPQMKMSSGSMCD
mmetsp:Transcript_30368/g.29738  ORF Transcript_30368/g.29738 Transcript_30368/m.29738 type:complete len:115 (-) Transcript_30368:310-654(-)